LSYADFVEKAEGSAEGERAARHHAKMWLALGDALLVQVARYFGGHRERLGELQRLAPVGAPFVRGILDGYRGAVAYRAAPARFSLQPDELERALPSFWEAFRRLEAHRLSTVPWPDPLAYASRTEAIFPHKRDIPRAARRLAGPRAALRGVIPWSLASSHPRETLGRIATLLAFFYDLDLARRHAARMLHTSPEPRSLLRTLGALREVGS
jgi:hypothetical protein